MIILLYSNQPSVESRAFFILVINIVGNFWQLTKHFGNKTKFFGKKLSFWIINQNYFQSIKKIFMQRFKCSATS